MNVRDLKTTHHENIRTTPERIHIRHNDPQRKRNETKRKIYRWEKIIRVRKIVGKHNARGTLQNRLNVLYELGF